MATRDLDTSMSDANLQLMLRIADEHCLPCEVKTTSASSRQALVEIQSGMVKRFDTVDDLIADLHAGD